MVPLPIIIGLAAVSILAVIYLILLYQFRYWNRRGIPQLNPSVPFGNVAEFFRQQLCIGDMYRKLYEQTKRLPIVGVYISFRPVLLLNDPRLIRTILVRDFDHFHDRGLHVNEAKDPLSAHLFALAGDKWRYHRSKLTPAFTANRLRGMFPIMTRIGRTLQEYVDRCVLGGKVVEVRDVMNRYTTDVIASVAFGLEIDSINDRENMFRRMGDIVFGRSLKSTLRMASAFFTPKLSEWFGIKITDQVVEDFMLSVVRKTVDYREKHNESRQDLMQLLLQLRNSGMVSVDEKWDLDASKSDKTLSLEQVASHAFVFLLAGYETSSSTISSCLFELARNSQIQHKVQQEIDEILSRDDGILTYENIASMKYLDCCIEETLRKYPPVPFLNRQCTKDYTLPNSNMTIHQGTAVVIPIRGIHRSPDYYPNPDKFIPERFSDENRTPDMPFYPFGYGPRICIGLRMGLLQTKIALVVLLLKYDIRLADDTKVGEELRYDPKAIIMLPVDGINLVFSRRSV